MFAALGRFVTRFPWYVVGAWVVLAFLVISFAPKLTSTSDSASFLPKHYESIKASDIKEKDFPGQRELHCDFIFVSLSIAMRVRAISANLQARDSDHQPLLLEVDDR